MMMDEKLARLRFHHDKSPPLPLHRYRRLLSIGSQISSARS
ncbi:hypothetical protein [Bradyrhizobium sp. CCGB20]|nr:hypothetical protein [Bradyrhizobium sp. CCGB20]